jgi:hypothetical protein
MENFASPSSPKKAAESIAARLNCWNCFSFRIAHTDSPTYPLSASTAAPREPARNFSATPSRSHRESPWTEDRMRDIRILPTSDASSSPLASSTCSQIRTSPAPRVPKKAAQQCEATFLSDGSSPLGHVQNG